jgi:hypothetical protein
MNVTTFSSIQQDATRFKCTMNCITLSCLKYPSTVCAFHFESESFKVPINLLNNLELHLSWILTAVRQQDIFQ